MCSLKAATRNFRALQPWEGQRRGPCPSDAGARQGRGLPGEERCPLIPRLLLTPRGTRKGAARISSPLRENRLLKKKPNYHFLLVTQAQVRSTGTRGREGRQLESSRGRHIPSGSFWTRLPPCPVAIPSGSSTKWGHVGGPGLFSSTSATASPRSPGHDPFCLGPSLSPLSWRGFGTILATLLGLGASGQIARISRSWDKPPR